MYKHTRAHARTQTYTVAHSYLYNYVCMYMYVYIYTYILKKTFARILHIKTYLTFSIYLLFAFIISIII